MDKYKADRIKKLLKSDKDKPTRLYHLDDDNRMQYTQSTLIVDKKLWTSFQLVALEFNTDRHKLLNAVIAEIVEDMKVKE